MYFTQVDVTSASSKVMVASKLSEAGLRMLTRDLALRCLIPGGKATKAEMNTVLPARSKAVIRDHRN